MNRMDDTFKCFGKTNRNYFYKFLLNLHNVLLLEHVASVCDASSWKSRVSAG
jgi:hypothetical protein